MKHVTFFLFLLCLLSCDLISRDVENSFLEMSVKLDSLNKLESQKIKDHFNEINSRRIKKWQGENSALIYYSISEFNQKTDSLVYQMHDTKISRQEKSQIIASFRSQQNEVLLKMRTVDDSINKQSIDSLLQRNRDFNGFPDYSVIAELKSQQFDITKLGTILIEKINIATTKSEFSE